MINPQVMDGNKTYDYWNWLFPLAAAVLTTILLFPLASRGVDFQHDGIMLKPAMDVRSGQTLFRDTFSQYGALTTYIHVLALKVSPTLLSIRYETVVAYAVSIFFLVSVWQMFLPRCLVFLAYGLFITFIPNYDSRWLLVPWSSVLALMFQSIAVLGLFECIGGERKLFWAILLGSSVACVFWCRQVVGGALAIAVLFVFLWLKLVGVKIQGTSEARIGRYVCLSFVITHCLFIFNLLASGSLMSWYENNFLWPKRMYATANLVFGSSWQDKLSVYIRPRDGIVAALLLVALWLPFVFPRRRPSIALHQIVLNAVYYIVLGLWLVLHRHGVLDLLTFPSGWSGGPNGFHGGLAFVVPFVVIFGSGIMLIVKLFFRNSESGRLDLPFALGCVSAASFLQYYPTFSLPQVFWSLAPSFGLFVYLIWKGFGLRAEVAALMLAIAFAPAGIQKIHHARLTLSSHFVELNEPAILRGMRVSPTLAEYISTLDTATQKILDKAPDTPITVCGGDALYATFANNCWNASPYYIDWPGLMSAEETKHRREKIHERRPIVLFQPIYWSTHDNVDVRTVEAFKNSERYVTIAEIPYQPLAWWFGGQREHDKATTDSLLRSMVVVAPEELVPVGVRR